MNQKIKDEARLAIFKAIKQSTEHHKENIGGVMIDFADLVPEKLVDLILSLSGKTAEVCDWCRGTKILKGIQTKDRSIKCWNCKGTGTIKKKWHYGIIGEDGRELK